MKRETHDKREHILAAARTCFLLYGFKRTAMDDIARAASVSRAALYLLFPNKEAMFRALSEQLHDAALERVDAALRAEQPIEERLVAAFEGKNLELLALVQSGVHGDELVDLYHGIGSDIAQQAEHMFRTKLTNAFEEANVRGDIDLAHVALTPQQCADLLTCATQGLKRMPLDIALYRQQLAQLMRVFCAALAPAQG